MSDLTVEKNPYDAPPSQTPMTAEAAPPQPGQAAQAADNPWAASDATSTAAPDNPWGDTVATPDAGGDWMGATPTAPLDATTGVDGTDPGFALHQLWDGSLPVESWINQGLDWVVTNFRPFFQTVRGPIDGVLTQMEGLLQSVPPLWMVAILSLLAWQCAGRGVAIGAAVSLLLVAMLGIWPEAMVTLSLVLRLR